jgi:DNA-binding NarL/FixJ family response regulator
MYLQVVLPYVGYQTSRPSKGTMGGMPARLLIVDDHEVVRMGVRTLLAGNPQWEVCGEAADGRQALERIAELAPDLVILDLTMPVMNGFEAAAEIRRIAPSTKIVFFSMHETPVTARLVGADAFVAKGSAVKDLPAALTRILQRERRASA